MSILDSIESFFGANTTPSGGGVSTVPTDPSQYGSGTQSMPVAPPPDITQSPLSSDGTQSMPVAPPPDITQSPLSSDGTQSMPVAPPPDITQTALPPTNDQLMAAAQAAQPVSPTTPPTNDQLMASAQAAQPPMPNSPDDTHLANLADNSSNPTALASVIASPDASTPLKQVASAQLANTLQNTKDAQDAAVTGQKLIATGDSAAISDALTAKMNDSTTGAKGSMLKAWLYRKLGMHDLADAEGVKLGVGSKVTPVQISNPDGTSFPAVVRMHADGSVVYGNNMATGEELTSEQLRRAEQASMVGAETSKEQHQFVAPDGTQHTVSSTILPNGRGIMYRDDTTGQVLSHAPSNLKPLGAVDIQERLAATAAERVVTEMHLKDAQNFAVKGQNLYSAADYQNAAATAYHDAGGARTNAAISSVSGTPQGSFGTSPLQPLNGSGSASTASSSIIAKTMAREGGYTPSDGVSGAPANYGINQRANPDVDVKNLTPGAAAQIYKDRYWNQIKGIDTLSPASQQVAFDAAVNQGVSYANNLVSTYGDNPLAMLGKRSVDYNNLAKSNPAQAPNLSGWQNRINSIANDITNNGSNIQGVNTSNRWTTTPTNDMTATGPSNASTRQQELDTQAKAIYNGLAPMPANPNSPVDFALQSKVTQLAAQTGVPYDPNKYKNNQDISSNFATGDAAKTVLALKTMMSHSNMYSGAIDALNNNNFTPINYVLNKMNANTGHTPVTTIQQIAPLLAAEAANVWLPGSSTEADRASIAQSFNSANSPAQLKTAISTMQEAAMGRLAALKSQYETTGNTNFWTKVVNDPVTQSAFNKYTAKNDSYNKPTTASVLGGFNVTVR